MLPVTILTGFLGGGKTTLVRRLLGSPWGRRIGILLNERGVAGIDDVGPSESGFVELAEGCVCCVDQPDLVAALELLSRRGGLERILLETTGLADPLPISWTVARPDLSSLVRLEAVVTVVDAANWERCDGEEWSAQVECADVVVMTKLDLVSTAEAERARSAVRERNRHAPLLSPDEALLALVGDEAIFSDARAEGEGGNRDAGPGRPPRGEQRPLARHGDYRTLVISGDLYDADALEDLVSDLPGEVFRAKGIARVTGDVDAPPGGRWLGFQVVGGRASVVLDAPAPSHGESRMAFFGRALDEDRLRTLVAACRAAQAEAARARRAVSDPPT